jgi:anti-sigma28 factor (negative regulator of flagellin synthesis)
MEIGPLHPTNRSNMIKASQSQIEMKSSPVETNQAESVKGLTTRIKIGELADRMQTAATEQSLRTDRIETARQRVESDYYDRDGIKHTIVDHLVSSEDIVDVAALEARESKMELIRQRIADGYYNTNEVKNEIADRLIDQMFDRE